MITPAFGYKTCLYRKGHDVQAVAQNRKFLGKQNIEFNCVGEIPRESERPRPAWEMSVQLQVAKFTV